MTFCRRALLCAIAALLAVAAPNVQAAMSASGMLGSELPAGVTLAKASIDQTAGAVKTAVAKDPADATEILRAAILAKMPKQGKGKLSCADIRKLTRAAIASDPQAASKLVDTASSLETGCADDLNTLITNRGDNGLGTDVDAPIFDVNGQNGGLGAGFPGSPGFVGSAPSGSFAFPPVVPAPVTKTTNS